MKNDDELWPQRERPDPAPTPAPESLPEPPMPPWAAYYIVGCVVGGITFIGTWVYCIAEYGFLLGVGLGWLPSLITGVVVGAAWPLLLLIALALVFWLYNTGAFS